MVLSAIIEALLDSGPFLAKIADKIGDLLFDDSDDTSAGSVDYDEIMKNLEPKMISLIDRRIQGMEKRLSEKMTEMQKDLLDDLKHFLVPTKEIVPSAPLKEVVNTDGPRVPRTVRRRRQA